jgi:hypothetical protein
MKDWGGVGPEFKFQHCKKRKEKKKKKISQPDKDVYTARSARETSVGTSVPVELGDFLLAGSYVCQPGNSLNPIVQEFPSEVSSGSISDC